MASKWSKPPPKAIFHSSFRGKTGQNGPSLGQIRLSKVPSAARKMLAKCIFGTKMHFASLCHRLFSLLGWAGGFPAWISVTACLCSIAV